METKRFQSALDSLLYLANGTYFDIAFACNHFAQYIAISFVLHWQGLKQIFRYLQGTKHLVLEYGGPNATTVLVGYSDADYAGCLESRRSIGGYAFLLGGAAIIWSSKKQSNVAGSTMEAKYTTINHKRSILDL